MDKKLKQQLRKIITGHRPRPLIFCGYHNGQRCYVRKKDLTYWELKEKHPQPAVQFKIPKPRHFLQKVHHLVPRPLLDKYQGYVMAGVVIGSLILITVFYVVKLISVCV